MYIDFKVTNWERAHFDSEEEEAIIINAIKENRLTSWGDLDDLLLDPRWEILEDVSEMMSVSENDGNATMEVYDNADKRVYHNGKD